LETNGSIDAEEASAALASVTRSRARVAWSGYPAWYWLATGACLGGLFYAMLLPSWWAGGIITGAGALLVLVIRAAGRTRGVCEGWVCTAMSRRDAVILYGPVAVVILADVVVSRFVSWSSIVAAVLVFVVFAGTGLMLSARAARW
jgi:hypothetical protein